MDVLEGLAPAPFPRCFALGTCIFTVLLVSLIALSAFPTSQLSSLAWTLSLVSPCDLDSRVSIMLLRDQDMSRAWGKGDGECHHLLLPHWNVLRAVPWPGVGVGFPAPSSPDRDSDSASPLSMAHFLLTPAFSLLVCLQGEFLAKSHDVVLPKQRASLSPPGLGYFPGVHEHLGMSVLMCTTLNLSVCLSLLGCRAIAVGHNSLFFLQNSLKKRGSRSMGKTEKKPSVQVSAPECPGHAPVTHQHPRSWCQLETEPRAGVNLGMAAPSPSCRALQSFPASQSPCIREGLMCWAILFVLNRSLVSFINGAAVARLWL